MAGAFACGVNDFYRADDYRSRHGSLSERQTRNGGKALWTTEEGEMVALNSYSKSGEGLVCEVTCFDDMVRRCGSKASFVAWLQVISNDKKFKMIS
jgi:hypothetical protein